jgi:threonine dehydratase
MDALEAATKIDSAAARRRLDGVLEPTPLEHFPHPDARIELRLKLECLQETNSFKARGAWNNLAQLDDAQRAAGVVATSSGNHGRALSWAARRAGVKATIFMPANVYPNKIEACRAEGAEVVLCDTRPEAEERCDAAVAAGAVLVHPYDALRTVEGAGTVGLEIARAWPKVELVLFPCGGGGLLAGSALAIARELGDEVAVVGVEPEGSRNLGLALEAGRPVVVDPITTGIQGLCPLDTGALNLALVSRYVEGMITLSDEEILAAQAALVRAGWTVEPAGAAAYAAVLHGALPPELTEDRGASNPLRVVCVVTGGNPDPAQLAALR